MFPPVYLLLHKRSLCYEAYPQMCWLPSTGLNMYLICFHLDLFNPFMRCYISYCDTLLVNCLCICSKMAPLYIHVVSLPFPPIVLLFPDPLCLPWRVANGEKWVTFQDSWGLEKCERRMRWSGQLTLSRLWTHFQASGQRLWMTADFRQVSNCSLRVVLVFSTTSRSIYLETVEEL